MTSHDAILTQIDRKVYGASPAASAESASSPSGEGEPGSGEGGSEIVEGEQEESASAVLSKLTKYIYNCQTSEQNRSAPALYSADYVCRDLSTRVYG